MGVLTLRNLTVLVARSSRGPMYVVRGTNKAAREALAKSAPYHAKASMTKDSWLYDAKSLRLLYTQVKMGIAD